MTLFKSKKTAVLIFDGAHWHTGVYLRQKQGGEGVDSRTLASRSIKQLPGSVVDYLVEQQVGAVRLLVPADLHSLSMEMPDDVEHEELHTALAYEVAEEMGQEAHLLRLATVEASVYGMGCEAGVYMMAGFDTRQIEGYVQQLKQVGIQFEGVGALELGLLALHAAHAEERLLLLRHRSGFYAVPGMEGQPFNMSSVQTGLEPEQSERDRERLVRFQRRLQAAGSVSMRVVTATMDGVPAAERVREVVPVGGEVEVSALDDVMPELMEQVLMAAVGDSRCACPLVGPPPAPKDPYRAGTWLCVAVVLLTLVYVGTRWHYLRVDVQGEQERSAAWSVLEKERERTSGHYRSLKERRDRQNRIYATLTATNRMSAGLLPLVDVLAVSIPQYTRITHIKQVDADHFEVKGVTRWAKGKIQLDRVLANAMGTVGMLVDPGPMTYQEDSREQQFSYQIVSKEAL